MNWAVFAWHFISYRFALILLIGFWLSQIKIDLVRINFTHFVILFILFLVLLNIWTFLPLHSKESSNFPLISYQSARWVEKNLGSDDVFAMKDAGNFGFYSRRKTINLDGLVNNFEYQKSLLQKEFEKYLKSKRVKYFVDHHVNRSQHYRNNEINYAFYSRFYNVWGDSITVQKGNEIYLSDHYYDGNEKVQLVIWEIR
jgi:hypothetical protein